MYFMKALGFHRPKHLICESGKPWAAAYEAAPIRKLCVWYQEVSRPQNVSAWLADRCSPNWANQAAVNLVSLWELRVNSFPNSFKIQLIWCWWVTWLCQLSLVCVIFTFFCISLTIPNIFQPHFMTMIRCDLHIRHVYVLNSIIDVFSFFYKERNGKRKEKRKQAKSYTMFHLGLLSTVLVK